MTHLCDLPAFPLLQFYTTTPYSCSYLPNRSARSQVATPIHLIDKKTYSDLVRVGFRRSGMFTYRPRCDQCTACLPVRLDVTRFISSRSQRRAFSRHSGLIAQNRELIFHEDHYKLYQRYQNIRHAGGGMDQDSREQYAQFLLQTHVDSRLVEFREDGILRIVSIIDVLDDGLSAVYTFYDCDVPRSSFGTYAILWQIAECKRLELPWLYLGYWIHRSPKMAYKEKFQPLTILRGGEWQAFVPQQASSP
jgi:arginine-tRNA-protein transferase